MLSPEEMAQLIDSARNLYHRTILMTLYSTGMRRAELCRLKVSDIDSQRMMIRIQQGKGRRDRDVPLSLKLLETLRVYWRWMKPKTFLFPGTVKGWRADVPRSALMPSGGPVNRPPKQQASPNTSPLIRCVTAAPPICWKLVPTSAPFRSYSATPD